MRNHVQLIAYADRLGGNLAGLADVLRTDLADAFGGVHILPFFTPYDGADAGFDPVDHTQVDPRLGTWDDVRGIARSHEVMVDLIVNHVSSSSAAFLHVREYGDRSPHQPMFLTMSSVFPDGATEADLARIYRPRPGLPFTAYRWAGQTRYVWTTFAAQQIDIDVRSDQGRGYLLSILDAVAAAGVRLVRLDAVGYAVKTAGTTCFMTPETFDFIAAFAALARERVIEVLVEVHSYYRQQVDIAQRVDLVYDFALPPLVLHALYTADGAALARWLRERPRNAITVLDTHDGIGVIDVGPDQTTRPDEEPRPGLLTPDQIDVLVEGIHTHSGGTSRRATGAAASNLDLYQVNCTFYDALGGDDTRYLAARVIQLLTPGTPQIYYVGALAGGNDLDLLHRTGTGRDINRHVYTRAEIGEQTERPVVRSLLALCSWRNTLPAFDGDIDVHLDGSVLTLVRRGVQDPTASAEAVVDLATGRTTLSWHGPSGSETTSNLLTDPPRA